MRIISKFKDYYDSALAYGRETDRVYVRDTVIWTPASKKKKPGLIENMQRIIGEAVLYQRSSKDRTALDVPKNRHLYVTPVLYCVGGTLYKALWVHDFHDPLHVPTQYYWHERNISNVSTGIPAFDPEAHRIAPQKMAAQNPDFFNVFDAPVFKVVEAQIVLSEWIPKNKEANHYWQDHSKYRNINGLMKWLDEPLPNVYVLASSDKIMTAVVSSKEAAVNPRLQDWKFFRCKDATQCMQELSMFLGNIAAPDTVPLVLDDKYRLQSHGFNERSFRKQPTKSADPKRAKRPHPDTPTP